MKARKNYSEAKAYSSTERLPIGGYVLKILNVDLKTYDWGEVIILSFDIAEGEQTGFYQKNYNSQPDEDKKWKGTYRLSAPDEDAPPDDWKLRRFKTVTNAFEDSNPGYHWDWNEQGLKGKLIGGLFNNKEYDFNGNHGFFTNCHSLIAVDKIRSGNFKIPDDTLLDTNTKLPEKSPDPSGADFMNIPDGISDDDVPFN